MLHHPPLHPLWQSTGYRLHFLHPHQNISFPIDTRRQGPWIHLSCLIGTQSTLYTLMPSELGRAVSNMRHHLSSQNSHCRDSAPGHKHPTGSPLHQSKRRAIHPKMLHLPCCHTVPFACLQQQRECLPGTPTVNCWPNMQLETFCQALVTVSHCILHQGEKEFGLELAYRYGPHCNRQGQEGSNKLQPYFYTDINIIFLIFLTE